MRSSPESALHEHYASDATKCYVPPHDYDHGLSPLTHAKRAGVCTLLLLGLAGLCRASAQSLLDLTPELNLDRYYGAGYSRTLVAGPNTTYSQAVRIHVPATPTDFWDLGANHAVLQSLAVNEPVRFLLWGRNAGEQPGQIIFKLQKANENQSGYVQHTQDIAASQWTEYSFVLSTPQDMPLNPGAVVVLFFGTGAQTIELAGLRLERASLDESPGLADRHLNRPGFALTWHDEFDGISLNPAKWAATTGYNNANNELQYYSPTNVFVSDGALLLKSDRVLTGGRTNYVSGKVTSSEKFAQRYGWFEWRGRIPSGQGIWPAYWMLTHGAWPPEIDVMETIGTTITCNTMSLHRGPLPPGCSKPWECGMSATSAYCGPDFSAGFHSFALDWEPSGATWYVDGVPRFATTNLGNCTNAMYLIMNTAIGGDWPGSPDANTPFPGSNRVDYVRVWTPLSGRYALLNPGFEEGEGVADFDNWNTYFNDFNCQRDPTTSHARSGLSCIQMWGRYTGRDNSTGLYQDLRAYPGETWRASVWARNRPFDSPQGGNVAHLKLEFIDAQGSIIADTNRIILSSTSSTNYTLFSVQRTAPLATTLARIVLEYFQTAQGHGSVNFDEASLEPVPSTRPTLAIAGVDSNLQLTWPVAAGVFNLQCASNLSPPISWQLVTNTAFNQGGSWTITSPKTDRTSFFRLSTP